MEPGVAGLNIPAFVERSSTTAFPARWARVSPGLTSRPSLSASGFAVRGRRFRECRRA